VAQVPSGEVTFVFTDIEGSTALFHELDEDYLTVLAHHNDLLRGVWAEHGGVEVKTEGDAFFVAFQDASSAVAAAARGQHVLALAEWPHSRPVRVRMGMHTGTAVVVDNDYVGLDVAQAARVAAAAHGGQVLLTEATAAACHFDEELGTHDLGEHRLKDFPTTRRLLQLTGPGLAATFPPPRTTTARSHNLPRPPSPLVGRLSELELVQRAVVGDARLVALTGSGGMGKTRLALEVGWSVLGWFREGVWFVDLAALTDAAAIPTALAQALGLSERSGASPMELLVERLGTGPSLLVLDNLEQVLNGDGITVVSDLLAGCADLTVLATSRERLRLRGEHEIVLDGLDVRDASELFVARARAADSSFTGPTDQVAAICRALDGIPLALELAAARVRDLDLPALLAELAHALDLLTEGDLDLPARHRTMRATVAWSWRLCDDEERAVLRSMAVFAGNVEPVAIEAVHGRVASATLERLIERSMVVRRGDRLGVLVPIRAFVAEQLDDTERDQLVSAHTDYFAELAVAAAPQLIDVDQVAWLDRLDADAPDLELAVRRATPDRALATAAALARWWLRRGRWSAGRELLATALDRAGVDGDQLTRSQATAGTAELAILQGRPDEALSLLERAEGHPEAVALLANLRGLAYSTKGELDEAESYFEQAQAAAAKRNDTRLVALAANNLGQIAHKRAVAAASRGGTVDDAVRDQFGRAREAWSGALRWAEGAGDIHFALKLRLNLAALEMALGEPAAAKAALLEARALAETLGDTASRARADANLGRLAIETDDDADAVRHLSAALAAAEEVGDVALQGAVLFYRAIHLVEGGDLRQNLPYIRRSIALAEQLGDRTVVEQRQETLAELLKRIAAAAVDQP